MNIQARVARCIGARSRQEKLAMGLGWFSLALGIAELIGVKRLRRAIGLEGREALIRAYGAREIATGLAILSTHDATAWVWDGSAETRWTYGFDGGLRDGKERAAMLRWRWRRSRR